MALVDWKVKPKVEAKKYTYPFPLKEEEQPSSWTSELVKEKRCTPQSWTDEGVKQ